MIKFIARIALYLTLLDWTGLVAQLNGPPGNPRGLAPYVLVGETGKSLDRSVKALIGKLFLADFEVLGKYSPANDPSQVVLIVTHRKLTNIIDGGPVTGYLGGVLRILVFEKGEFTYIVCQDPQYWLNVYFGAEYPSIGKRVQSVRRDLLKSMPKLRGRFMQPYAPRTADPLEIADLREYRFNKRAPDITGLLVIKEFESHAQAVSTIADYFAGAGTGSLVFKKNYAQGRSILYGISIDGIGSDRELLSNLPDDDLNYSAALPYEMVLNGYTLYALPLSLRLPLSAPAMSRKQFKKVKKFERQFNQRLTELF